MKKIISCLIFLSLTLIVGCAKKNTYPPETVANFMNACTGSGGSAETCGCVLEKVQAKYTLKEFIAIEAQVAAGTANPDFAKASATMMAECVNVASGSASGSDSSNQAESEAAESAPAPAAVETPKLEFPYKAVLVCGQPYITILACFGGDVGTEIELTNGEDYGMYTVNDIASGRAGGKMTNEGYVIELRESFELKVQNSSDSLILNMKVFDQASGEKLFEKSAGHFGAISVKN